MPIPWTDAAVVAQILAPGGIAAIAVKYVLNGSREGIRRIETKQDRHFEILTDLSERTVRIETLQQQCPVICDPTPRPRRRKAQ